MPKQNTSPADYPQAVLRQIELLAQNIAIARKRRGETQAQWASKLGISQPTMARIERGDPAVAMATYISCLWQLNPALDLTLLLAPVAAPKLAPASDVIAGSLDKSATTAKKASKPDATVPEDQQTQIARNFAAAKAALDFFKSPMF